MMTIFYDINIQRTQFSAILHKSTRRSLDEGEITRGGKRAKVGKGGLIIEPEEAPVGAEHCAPESKNSFR